jgi:hypothetical protein
MNSFDLDERAADWRSLGSPATDLVEGVRRHERAMRRSPAFGIAAIVILAALLYRVMDQALAHGGAHRWLVAAAFAVAVPITIYSAIGFWRQARMTFDLSPVGSLRRDRARLEVVRNLIISGRASAIILVLATVGLCVPGVLGAIDLKRFILSAAAWTATAAALWTWQRMRAARLAHEIAAVDEMLEQFREAETADLA